MSFMQKELERIEAALHEPQSERQWHSYYAAQQALAWALEPECFKSPYDMVNANILVAPKDYLENIHRSAS